MYNSGTTDASKNVVDTVTGSTWYANINDGAAGKQEIGGSANPITTTGAVPGFANHMVVAKVISNANVLTTGASPVTAFTVTGDVVARVWGTVQTSLASTSSTGTLAVGVTGNTAVFLAQTTADGTSLVTGTVWIDATATTKGKAFITGNLAFVPIAGSANIIITVATNSMTSGALTLYCEYYPVSAGGKVVAA
jgi:hypothetical protein